MDEKVLPVHMLTGSRRSLAIAGRLVEEIKNNRLEAMEIFGIIDAMISLIVFLTDNGHDKVLEQLARRIEALKMVSKDNLITAQIQSEISGILQDRSLEHGEMIEGIDAVLVKFKDRQDPGGNLN